MPIPFLWVARVQAGSSRSSIKIVMPLGTQCQYDFTCLLPSAPWPSPPSAINF